MARALVLPDAPDAASGEITDKGYIAQALARQRRAGAIARRIGYQEPNVHSALAKLIELGLVLRVERRAHRGRDRVARSRPPRALQRQATTAISAAAMVRIRVRMAVVAL